jgi:hypothetical protein
MPFKVQAVTVQWRVGTSTSSICSGVEFLRLGSQRTRGCANSFDEYAQHFVRRGRRLCYIRAWSHVGPSPGLPGTIRCGCCRRAREVSVKTLAVHFFIKCLCSDVGSGLLLGGGISYLANAVGYSADTMREVDVVLVTGEVVTANAKNKYSDLFRALKGGANRFGIVTRYVVDAIPTGTKDDKHFFGGEIVVS